MQPFKRTDRLNHQFKEELSRLLLREVKDPRIGFCTITRVAITNDLSLAKVYVSVLGDAQQKKDSMKGLKKSAGFMRHQLGQILTLRNIPELRFILDENAEHAQRISELIHQIHDEDSPDE